MVSTGEAIAGRCRGERAAISQDTSAYGVDVKHRTGFRQRYAGETSGQPVKLAKLGIWVRLHYVYPYPHVDEDPLMAEGKILPYSIFRCNTPARAF